MSSDYRLSPALGARLVGLLVVALAVLMFVATGVVAVLDLHPLVLVPVALAVLAGVFGAPLSSAAPRSCTSTTRATGSG